MREIQASTITDVVEKLCIEANYHLPEDVKCAITGCRACEDGEIAKGVLDKIVENYEIADAQNRNGMCFPGNRTGCAHRRRRSCRGSQRRCQKRI